MITLRRIREELSMGAFYDAKTDRYCLIRKPSAMAAALDRFENETGYSLDEQLTSEECIDAMKNVAEDVVPALIHMLDGQVPAYD